jgi:RNA polymerase sigma-70 factor (ECF subfamily)
MPSPLDRAAPVTSSAALEGQGEPDRELAVRVLAGDEPAFRELYERHTPRLFQLALRLVGGDTAQAEDVVQDTWIKATEKLDTFRWESAFGTWLGAIGINVAREATRRHGRRHEVEWDDGVEPPAAAPLERLEPVDLERAIATLPDGYRAVLVLHDVEGYTHEEIAAQLGVAVGTTKSQLFWARRAIRAQLAPEAKGETS